MIWLILFLVELGLIFYSGRRLQQRVLQRFGLWVFAAVYLPATYLHEMSHFLVAQILGVPSELGSFVPKRKGNQIILGRVLLGKTSFWKRVLVGVAPFVFGAVLSALLVYAYQIEYFSGWQILLFVGGLFQTVSSMYLSPQDLKGIRWLIYFVLIIFIYFLYLVSDNYLVSSYLQNLVKFLALPIGFNFVLASLLRLLD